MDDNSRIGQFFSTLGDRLADQVWYQQLKAKWDELDDQSKAYARSGIIIGTVVLLVFLTFNFWWGVHKLKKEVAEKSDLLSLIQTANDEMKRLKETSVGVVTGRPDAAIPWPAYFENTATALGIDKSLLVISPEKTGPASDIATESFFDITVKHVNIKQVVRFAFSLENGTKPVRLRNLAIDTKNSASGYMDATLAVSAFLLKPGKE